MENDNGTFDSFHNCFLCGEHFLYPSILKNNLFYSVERNAFQATLQHAMVFSRHEMEEIAKAAVIVFIAMRFSMFVFQRELISCIDFHAHERKLGVQHVCKANTVMYFWPSIFTNR